MKNDHRTSRKLLSGIAAGIVAAILLGGAGLYVLQNTARMGVALAVFLLLVIAAVAFAGTAYAGRMAVKKLNEIKEKTEWYKSILDSIDFPVHVTDNDMNWTFLNRAFEKLMIDQGNIKDRESAYGRACSNAGANICKTENCGITQLRKGVGYSYFDWCGMSCKQDTTYLTNSKGERIGFVEVVTDLTSILRVNDYNAVELKRIVANLNMLAAGNLELDLNVGAADSYTKDSFEDFSKISQSLEQVKNALGLMIRDADTLAAREWTANCPPEQTPPVIRAVTARLFWALTKRWMPLLYR